MRFKYSAIDQKTRERINGMADAVSMDALLNQLKERNQLLVKATAITETKKTNFTLPDFFPKDGVKSKELVVFTHQLAATLNAGLLLTESLDTIAEDMENPFFSKIVAKLRSDIESGTDFSTALSKYPKIFNNTYVAIIKAGEATGTLHKSLSSLAKHLEDAQKLQDKIVTAVRYPMFVLSFAMMVVAVMVLFLIPKFASMFARSGQELPLLTRIVLGISNFAIHNIIWIILAVFAIIIGFHQAMKNPTVQFKVDEIKLQIPLMGKQIFHKALLSRFSRILGFLLSNGITLGNAIDISAEVVDHKPTAKALEEIKQQVMGGSYLSDAMKRQKIFPAMVCKMTAVGERTGKLPDLLQRSADYYDSEMDNTLSRLTAILEPALIVFVGGIVLIVVLALYLPIFKMSAALK